jgi:hypothetical protein
MSVGCGFTRVLAGDLGGTEGTIRRLSERFELVHTNGFSEAQKLSQKHRPTETSRKVPRFMKS